MTREQFQAEIEVKKDFSFNVDGVEFNVSKEKDLDGTEKYFVREDCLPPCLTYHSFSEMMADCVLKNHYLRDIIRDLKYDL